jgi:hypothetical protein
MNYNPNDFFYVKFDEKNDSSTLSNLVCSPLKPYDYWDISCNIENYNIDNSNKINCNLKELCKNKEKVQYLQSMQNIHNGSDQNYLDAMSAYNTTLRRSINLGIGIIIVIGLIYSNRK